MASLKQKKTGVQPLLPRPVERMLQGLGRDLSSARRVRKLSQEDLAERIGTSVSTVRRMEDGYPGTALHTFLRALLVLGRLDAIGKVMAVENDVLGLELAHEQLPQRVRTSRGSKARASSAASKGNDSDELEGF